MTKKIVLLLTVSILFSGCMSEIAKKNIPVVELPKEKQVKNITKYNDTLRCMDTLYKITNDTPIVAVENVKNETANKEKLPDNFKSMLLTALNKMGSHVRVVPEDSKGVQYIIKPAITEFDFYSSQGAGAYFGASVGKGKGETDADSRGGYSKKVSTMAIDFNIINNTGENQYYEPYVSTSYKMKITSINDSNDFGVSIYGNGFGMNANISKSQGLHSAIRLLLEISLSELFGELNALPYWKCRGGKYDTQYEDRVNYIYDLFKKGDNGLVLLVQPFLYKWNLIKENDTKQNDVSQAVIMFKKQNGIYPADSTITRFLVFKLLSSVPPEQNLKNNPPLDLFRKYSSVEDIKIYSRALAKKQNYQKENYFEQNKKLDSLYRLYKTRQRINPNIKLYINSFVNRNSELFNANSNAIMAYKLLIKKGINRGNIVKKASKLNRSCTASKEKQICEFKNSYILFDIK